VALFVRTEDQRIALNSDTLAAAKAVINFSVSNPRIMHLLPISIKLWQANLLVCKQGKISGSSQFSTQIFQGKYTPLSN